MARSRHVVYRRRHWILFGDVRLNPSPLGISPLGRQAYPVDKRTHGQPYKPDFLPSSSAMDIMPRERGGLRRVLLSYGPHPSMGQAHAHGAACRNGRRGVHISVVGRVHALHRSPQLSLDHGGGAPVPRGLI